jgi:hypothetical protein
MMSIEFLFSDHNRVIIEIALTDDAAMLEAKLKLCSA